MALKRLIENQTIIIDDHRRGTGEVKNWDDKTVDVHIDKTTNLQVEGKKQKIRIRIPINSQRPIRIENSKRQHLDKIPTSLIKEIKKAFDDKQKRELFIKDIIDHIKNFPTILESENRVQQVLANISKHFDLLWTTDKIATYSNDVLTQYSQKYTDKDGRNYYMSVESKKIELGEINGFARNKNPFGKK